MPTFEQAIAPSGACANAAAIGPFQTARRQAVGRQGARLGKIRDFGGIEACAGKQKQADGQRGAGRSQNQNLRASHSFFQPVSLPLRNCR
jgi:hypothetical protein